MAPKKSKNRHRHSVLRLSDLDHSKSAVLNGLTLLASRRTYEYASPQRYQQLRGKGNIAVAKTLPRRIGQHRAHSPGFLKFPHLAQIPPRLASVLVTQKRHYSQDRQVGRRKRNVRVQGMLAPFLHHLRFKFLEYVPRRDVCL